MLVLHKVTRQLGLTYPGTTGKRVGLVGLVITTNPRFLPSDTRLIRRFILTDTFDRFNTATQRRSLENANYLRLMGRRMWSHNGPANIDRAADLVAPMVQKCGCKEKYDEDQMFGVPALLCRLGLRVTPSSPLAARLVDEFGAMLLYADPTRDVYVAENVSEPMLALGAAFAWYQDKYDPLAKCILPHFREMVAHELIRLPSRGVDEIVARIVFLMAMDFAAVNPTERTLSSSRRYNGHLTSLRVFLQALSGESFRAIRWTRHGTERDRSSDAEAFVRKWDDWLLGFTQFIQLPRLLTPTVLRVLLERRAAGVFPSSNRNVDWVIPIAKDWPDGEVSMLLVHVERHFDDDAELNDDEDEMVARHRIQTALRRLRPSSVWAKEPQNPLGWLNSADVLRIYVDLRDGRCASQPLPNARCFVHDSESAETSLALCLCGRSWWRGKNLSYDGFVREDVKEEKHAKLEPSSTPRCGSVPFLSYSVARQLRLLLSVGGEDSDAMAWIDSRHRRPGLERFVSADQMRETIKATRVKALYDDHEYCVLETSTVTDRSLSVSDDEGTGNSTMDDQEERPGDVLTRLQPASTLLNVMRTQFWY